MLTESTIGEPILQPTSMKPCVHPPDKVTADVCQGDWQAHAVQWCQICGSVRVRVYTDDIHQRIKYTSPWIIPVPQQRFNTRKRLEITETHPIELSDFQESAVKEWAKDDRLWTTQETVEFNLRVFARKILTLNMIGFLLLAAHAFGDGPLQNHWMQRKSKSSLVCTVHVAAYAIPFCALVIYARLPLWALAAILAQHWLQDRFALHLKWMRLYKQTPPDMWPVGPLFMDQAWHVAFLGFIAFWLR